MIKDDLKIFSGIMKAIAINSGAELTSDIMKLYFKTLQGFTIEQIEKAAAEVLTTWKANRMPPLAIIIEHITGSDKNNAMVIANQIIAHIQGPNVMEFPNLHNDMIAKYLITKRWPYSDLAYIETDAIKWWVKDFCDAYTAMANSPDSLLNLENPTGKLKELSESSLKGM